MSTCSSQYCELINKLGLLHLFYLVITANIRHGVRELLVTEPISCKQGGKILDF